MVWGWNLSLGFWIQSQCSFCPTTLPSQRSKHHLRWSSLHRKQGSQTHETQWLLKGWKIIWQSILLAPEGTVLNCLSPIHTVSHTHTHTHTHTHILSLSLSLSISLSNQLAVCTEIHRTSQTVLLVKNPPADAGDARDVSSIPGLGRSPGEENGNPFQYSGLENSMDRGAWWVTGHGVKKS